MFNNQDIKLNRILYLFRRSHEVFIVGHLTPDGDAVGSMLALKIALERDGKEVHLALEDTVPKNLIFLSESFDIELLKDNYKQIRKSDLLISLDSATYERTGIDKYYVNPASFTKFLNIDHHPDNPSYGTLNYIDSEVSSTAEILYNIFEAGNIPINQTMATCLLNGIFFDTGSFQNSNTSIATLKATSQLLAMGASLKQVTKYNLKNKSLKTLRLWGRVLSRIKKNRDMGIVSTVVTKKDLDELGTTGEDLEGIANFLNSIPDSKISLVLSERETGKIKGSLRTLHDNVDVSKVASFFGGGGHPKAAGFTISGSLSKNAAGWSIA